MAMSEKELTAALQAIANNIQKVVNYCGEIKKASGAMYDVVDKECFPTLSLVQKAWMGGTSDRYVTKANEKMNDIVQDCVDVSDAAESILAKYLEHCKQEVKALGVDPHTAFPDLF